MEPEPFNAPVLVDPAGRPARLPRTAACPQCGAGPQHRITSGMGMVREVTCERCAYEFPKERVS